MLCNKASSKSVTENPNCLFSLTCLPVGLGSSGLGWAALLRGQVAGLFGFQEQVVGSAEAALPTQLSSPGQSKARTDAQMEKQGCLRPLKD